MDFINQFYQECEDFENELDNTYKKETGSYYTNQQLVNTFIYDVFEKFSIKELLTKKILEPCIGSGNYIYGMIWYLYNRNVDKQEIQTILNNTYVADINEDAIDFYKMHINKLLMHLYEFSLSDMYFQEHIGYNLIFNIYDTPIQYRTFDEVFPTIDFKFDIIVTNPPYRLLKFNKQTNIGQSIESIINNHFPMINKKNLNLYKFFLIDLIRNYANTNACISLLIPQSFLKDKISFDVRDYVYENTTIESVYIFNEKNAMIKASQALCNILLLKTKTLNYDFVIYDNDLAKTNGHIVNIHNILNNPLKEILYTNNNDFIAQLNKYPKIKDIPFIVNKRGELDLSIHKNMITLDKTSYKLARGKDIGNGKMEYKTNEYVIDDFVCNHCINKRMYVTKKRLVCQQISNANKKKRLNFVLCNKNIVLADSCNFIAILDNEYDVDYYFLMAILNSPLIEQYFCLFNSNNHISNYEIDNLPIPLKCTQKYTISSMYKKYLETNNSDILNQIESLVNDAYGICDKRELL